MKNIKYLFVVLFILLIGWIGRTQDQNHDVAFVRDAVISGLFEVQAGKLAAARATSAEVKDLGKKMVADHSKAGEELKQLALRKNIAIPDSLDAKMKAIYDSVAISKGKAFDAKYVQQMLKAHEVDVNKFEAATKSLVDSDLRAWAAKTLPVLKMHYKHVQQVSSNMSNDNNNKKAKKENKS